MTDPCPLHTCRHRPCAPCGVARVRAALAAAPRPARPDAQPADTNPTRARALARARHERTQR